LRWREIDSAVTPAFVHARASYVFLIPPSHRCVDSHMSSLYLI
jgi:hypothetical protein